MAGQQSGGSSVTSGIGFDVCKAELARKDIGNRRDFRFWARTNHPDRGGDLSTFQRVSECADMVFDERGEPLQSPRRGSTTNQNEEAIAEMLAKIIARAVASCRTREIGTGYRYWGQMRLKRFRKKNVEEGEEQQETLKKVSCNGIGVMFREIGIVGMKWRPIKELELCKGTQGRGSVHMNFGMPFVGHHHGIRIGFGGIMMPQDNLYAVMLSLSKRYGPLQLDAMISRRQKHFDRSFEYLEGMYGARLEVINVNADGVQILPGIVPRIVWRKNKGSPESSDSSKNPVSDSEKTDSPSSQTDDGTTQKNASSV